MREPVSRGSESLVGGLQAPQTGEDSTDLSERRFSTVEGEESKLMIGVLLFSREKGRISAWAAVRGSTEIRVSGMSEGDTVKVRLKGNGYSGDSFFWTDKNISFDIPKGVTFIQAEHSEEGENPDVCVELF